ncbi:MAG TPA: glycoside hydrolase family 9 protein [Solirubrobacteraceae bacterium]
MRADRATLARVCVAAGLLTVAGGCAGARAAPGALLRVDQAGYPAGEAKPASLMTRRAGRPPAFTVTGPAGRVVLRGHAGHARGSWSARWRAVYPLRLDRLTRPGRYVLRAAGAPAQAIRVAPAAALYGPLAAREVSFLQAQRDGPDVIAGALGRVPAHLFDARATLYAVPRYRGLRLAQRLIPAGGETDVSGGWSDAGDYLKFAETASFTDVMMLFSLREYGASLPGRAELEREARYGTDWLLRAWDPARGVLVYQVGIGDGNGTTVLGDHDLWRLPQADDRLSARPGSPRYFIARRPALAANAPGALISPNLAGRLSAAFGLCAQVFAASDPAYARRCLTAGRTLFNRANTHPRGELLTTSPHAYYNENEWRDDMELGATELYLAGLAVDGPALPQPSTDRYVTLAGRWADAYMLSRRNGEDSLNLYDVSALAHYDLAHVLRSARYAQLQGLPGVDVPTGPAALAGDVRQQLALARRLAARDPLGFGSASGAVDTVPHALGIAVQARLYDRLVGRPVFEAFARDQLSWVLGRNAWGSSFVVGAGALFPRCLSHQVANLRGSLSGHGALLAGATVDGPQDARATLALGAPDGYRRCPAGSSNRFAPFDGHGLRYRDDVRSPDTSEPTDDYAALALTAFAQQAGAGG